MSFTANKKNMLSQYGAGFPTELPNKTSQYQYHCTLSEHLFDHYEKFSSTIRPILDRSKDFVALNKLASNITSLHNLQCYPEAIEDQSNKSRIEKMQTDIIDYVQQLKILSSRISPILGETFLVSGDNIIKACNQLAELLNAIIDAREPKIHPL